MAKKTVKKAATKTVKKSAAKKAVKKAAKKAVKKAVKKVVATASGDERFAWVSSLSGAQLDRLEGLRMFLENPPSCERNPSPSSLAGEFVVSWTPRDGGEN